MERGEGEGHEELEDGDGHLAEGRELVVVEVDGPPDSALRGVLETITVTGTVMV